MINLLSEIDSIYKETISKLPLQNRIDYCEHLIDKAQINFSRNKSLMSEKLKNQLLQIIQAASNEIVSIKNNTHQEKFNPTIYE